MATDTRIRTQIDHTAATLAEVVRAVAAGDRPPPCFNQAWLAMLPKGTEATETRQQVARSARALRPLVVKNTDAKAIASAVARTMRKIVSAKAHGAQSGFVARRDLTAPPTS